VIGCLLSFTSVVKCDEWLDPISSRFQLINVVDKKTDDLIGFGGNNSFTNNFKLLIEGDSSIIVGGRNAIYNLSLSNLQEIQEETIRWNCRPEDNELCSLKGRSFEDCQNYIQVMAVLEPSTLFLVCGTNCYSPLCRHYRRKTEGGFEVEKQFRGRGYAPYHPSQNSSFLYTSGHLYAATVADFSGMDALIMKDQLRTEQYDFRHLNAPDFVSTLEDRDYVYIFFRETALEVMNCGKSIYSRVARVCKTDEGGSHKFSNRWTTFLKARVNCSVPGDYPFYFNEIQSTTDFVFIPGAGRVVYAVFTTPVNSIPGSAICRFSMDDLQQSFNSDFQNQESANSHWLPLAPSKVPSPRPGKCNNQSSSLSESSLHFIKNHCLMEKAVPSNPSMPVFIRASDSELLTKIAIHPGASDLYGNTYDILFVGTNRGRVITILTSSHNPDIRTSQILEEEQIFSPAEPVLSLKITTPGGPSPQLIIVSADSVKAIRLYKCQKKQPDSLPGCRSCVSHQRPYCAWDKVSGTCVEHRLWSNKSQLVQAENQCPPHQGDQWESNIIEHDKRTIKHGIKNMRKMLTNPFPFPTNSIQTDPSTTPSPSSATLKCSQCNCTCSTSSTVQDKHEEISRSNSRISFEDEIFDEMSMAESVRNKKELSFEMVESYRKELHMENQVVTSEIASSPHFISVNIVLISVATGLVSLFFGFLSGLLASRLCNSSSVELTKASQDSVESVNVSSCKKRRNTNDSTVKPNHSANQESTDDIVVDITTKPVKQEKRSEKDKKVKRMYI